MPWRDRDRGGLTENAGRLRSGMYDARDRVVVVLRLSARVTFYPKPQHIQLPVGFPPQTSLIRVAPHALKRRYGGSGDGTIVGPDKADSSSLRGMEHACPSRSSGFSEIARTLRGCPSVLGCPTRSGEGGWETVGSVAVSSLAAGP